MLGLPLSFDNFAWPFHASTSGADTFIVHGQINLETGGESILHAKVSASLTRTFAEVVVALEQPFAESFIYNAVRKTLDQGQLELVKSGNRQPVPVTTRYHSAKQNRFIFNDTTEQQRTHFLAGKIYWLSGVLGGGAPVWITDPRDAQYLNTTTAELAKAASALAGEGLLSLSGSGDWASATAKLQEQRERFEAEVRGRPEVHQAQLQRRHARRPHQYVVALRREMATLPSPATHSTPPHPRRHRAAGSPRGCAVSPRRDSVRCGRAQSASPREESRWRRRRFDRAPPSM